MKGENVIQNQISSNNKCWCERKKHHVCQKDYIWNLSTCSCGNRKYLVFKYYYIKIINMEAKLYNEEPKTVPTSFNETNVTSKI